MSAPVNEKSPGGAGRGQARTRLARRAVIDSARALFLERGYQGTTIDAISQHSDVPAPTVYRLFSSKLGILKSVLDVSIGGDDRDVAMLDRPEVRSMLASADPKEQLAGFAAMVRGVMERAGSVHRILADASRSDHEAAALLQDIARQRHTGQRRIAESLARMGALKPGLSERDAADIIHALASPEVYGLLVLDRGWNVERYENWLSSILTDQLLVPSAARRRRR